MPQRHSRIPAGDPPAVGSPTDGDQQTLTRADASLVGPGRLSGRPGSAGELA
jgi:hypothetical protein